jgi:AraC-like DNA-binding protein
MIHWVVQFQTFRPTASLPRLDVIASETVYDTSYRNEGKYRRREETCLFKYSLSGEGVFRDAAGEHRVPAGWGFLCEIRNPDTAYYYPPEAREPWGFVYMSISGEASRRVVLELLDRHGPLYELPRNEDVITQMLACGEYRNTRPQISSAEGARRVTSMLTTLLESKEPARLDDPGHRLTLLAIELIRENLHRNMNVTELADRLRVSREHLTRVFKEHTLQTPWQYVLRQKMLHACRLLKTTQLTHKEIAVALGYDTPAHFTRTFKHILGMTPGRFRAVGTIPLS